MSQIANHTTVDLSNGYVNLRTIGVTAGDSLEFIAKPLTSLTAINLGRLVADGHNALVGFEGAVTTVFTHYYSGAGLSVINDNTIYAKHTGTIDVRANLNQTSNGVLMADSGGTLSVEGIVTGGIVKVSDATLSLVPNLEYGGPHGTYESVESPLVLGGASDVIAFPALGQNGQGLQELFNSATNDLTVFETGVSSPNGGGQLADLHLVGAYTAADFSVHGNEVLFKPV